MTKGTVNAKSGTDIYEQELQKELILLMSRLRELEKSIDPELRKRIEKQERKLIANLTGEEVISEIGAFLLDEGLEAMVEKILTVSSITAAAIVAPFSTTRVGDGTMTHYKNVEKVTEMRKIQSRISQIVGYFSYSHPPQIGGLTIDKAQVERARRLYQGSTQCVF